MITSGERTVSQANRRRVFVIMCLLVVGGFTVFEIGVRLLPPDTVRYEIQIATNGSPAITQTGTITDPATIARLRAEVTAKPSGQLLIGTLIGQWRGQDTCAPLSYYSATYVFLWHGVTIEAFSSLPTCDEQYAVSSGGLPDPRTFYPAQPFQP